MVQFIGDIPLTANAVASIDGVGCAEGSAFANSNNLDRALATMIRNEFAAMQTTVTAATVAAVAGIGQSGILSGATTISAWNTAVTGLYREMVAGTTLVLAPTTALGLHRMSANATLDPSDIVRGRSLGAGNWVLAIDRKVPRVTPLALLDNTGTAGYVLTAAGAGVAPAWAAPAVTQTTPPVRQTVLRSAVTSDGLANFISAGVGLSVSIAATSVPIYLTAANGFGASGSVDRIGAISADTTIGSLTANQTNYLYADIAADGTVTLGKTLLAPVYQFGGTYSTTSGQFTFNIQEMTGKVGNGATADQTYRVFIGEAVTNGAAVTSVVNYALMGRYLFPVFTSTLPGANTAVTISHNLGVKPSAHESFVIKCTSTDNGYAVDDISFDPTFQTSGVLAELSATSTRLATTFATGNGVGFYLNPKTGGIATQLTAAKWSYGASVTRGW